MFDCVIIGAGPGGLTSAIYLLRSQLKVAIIEESMPGGQVANTSVVENYPGFDSIDGVDLAMKMYNQVTNLGVEYISGKALDINKLEDNSFEIKLSDEVVKAKTIIIATGMKHRKLGVPGEDRFVGRGVSWCAICDGNLYKSQDVAVVGGGNSALEESIYLSGIVNKVYLIHRRDQFRGDPLIVERIKQKPNVELILNDEIIEMNGEDGLEVLTLRNKGPVAVKGLFEYIGFLPSSELVAKFNVTNKDGFIEVDENCETRVNRMFAVGDITQRSVRQIVTAVGDGAVAALNAVKHCRQ